MGLSCTVACARSGKISLLGCGLREGGWSGGNRGIVQGSSITAFELLHGLERCSQTEREREKIEELLEVLPFCDAEGVNFPR